MSGVYVIRPKADRDLDEQAYYLANQANPEVGHRFLLAAHETFGLLAANPEGGIPGSNIPNLLPYESSG